MNPKLIIILIKVLIFSCSTHSSAFARSWAKIGETELVVIYVDRSSIESTANGKRAWEMQDLKSPDSDGVLSRLYMNEFDCKLKLHRISQVTSYSGKKLSGRKMVEVPEAGYWRKIPTTGLFVVGYILHCVD
jgi:hypothetical protein